MFKFLRRAFVLIVGFVLSFLVIWYAGPYFAFDSYKPLETPMARLILFGVVVGGWLVKRLLRRLKAFRASDRLLAAVVAQPQAEPNRPPGEVLKLRERFEEAVSALKKGRRGGHSLYELPWYVIIGAPGSGKTTALLNSGLKFPLEQRMGKGALRGVGGTRNCDWWFTDDAVFLDTAGRYTTQDSDATSDSAGWSEFLGLLRKYRARRPLNGVILTVDAQQLLAGDAATREMHVEAARNRLAELVTELRIQLPVYVMVTKCDLVDGFSEYFEDLSAQQRAQVWGVTFPYDDSLRNEGPRTYPAEFDALMTRLNDRVFERVETAGDTRHRAKVFAFPQQAGAMRDPLTSWIADVFDARAFEGHVLLRGVYFTSGTQEGTPIDRLLGSIAKRFRAADAVLRPSGPGKAYFVESLLKQVMIGESGLAGVNRRLELRNASILLAAYVVTGILAVLALIALTVSYQRNREFLAEMAAHIATFEETARVSPLAPLPAIADRLNALRVVMKTADEYRAGTSWLASWGLYQGSSIGNPARDAYAREFDTVVLPRLRAQLEARLREYARDQERLPTYLKAYLMVGRPEQDPDADLIRTVADMEWQGEAGAGTPVAMALSDHFKERLTQTRDNPLSKPGVNASLVSQARSNLGQMDRAKFFYQSIKVHYLGAETGLRIDQAAGVGSERVLRRRSGKPLSTPVPRLYTPEKFKEIKAGVSKEIYEAITKDAWVWGETSTSALSSSPRLVSSVIQEYESDYVKAWNELLADIEIVPFSTTEEARQVLRILSDRTTSPLRGLLRVVHYNTSLWQKPTAAEKPQGFFAEKTKQATDLLKTAKAATGVHTEDWGRQITFEFQWVAQLLGNDQTKTPLDAFLESLAEALRHLDQIAPEQLGGQTASKVIADPEFFRLMGVVKRQADDLSELDNIVRGLGTQPREVVIGAAQTELEELHSTLVVPTCAKLIDGRYPFAPSPSEVAVADFAAVFGYDGLFDRFFAEHLAAHVDTSRPNWTSRPGALQVSDGILRQFRDARAIREMFFPQRSTTPQVEFSLTYRNLDRGANRFFLELDGFPTAIERQPSITWRATWPGSRPGVRFKFEERLHTAEQSYVGTWGWFRLVDEKRVRAVGGAQVVRLQLRDEHHQVDVDVHPASANRDPFSNRNWRDFRCGR